MAMTTKKPQPRNKLWIIHASTLRRFSRVEHSDNWRLPQSQIWGDLCAFNHSLIIRRQKYSGIHERNMMSSVCIGTRHAASFLKKSLDQQYDLFKCLSGYTGRRERRRLTNIIFCIIAYFLLFFFTMPTSSWCDVGKKVTSPYKMVYSIRKRSTFCCPV